MSVTLASSSGSVENLNVSAFHGRIPYFFQALVTVDLVHPQAGSQQPTRPVSHPQTLRGKAWALR